MYGTVRLRLRDPRVAREKQTGQGMLSTNAGGTAVLPSERVIRALKQIIEWRGRPNIIRCDNGLESISGSIQNWASEAGIAFQYIQPGKPQQNAYVERFNRTVRYEWLSQYYWGDLDEIRDFASRWISHYNHDRPNMALGGITPKQRLAMAA